MSCSGIVHFQLFCVFSIFCARGKSQKTGRICSRGSLLLTLLGSWEGKGGFIKQFYLKNSALLSHTCYLKEQTFEIYDKEGDHKVNLRYKCSNTFFGRSAFTGVWVGVILAFLPWVQVEPRADVNDLPPSLPLCPCVRHCTSSSRQSFPRCRWEGRQCKSAPSSKTFHFLQVVFNPELSSETLNLGALYLKKYLSWLVDEAINWI